MQASRHLPPSTQERDIRPDLTSVDIGLCAPGDGNVPASSNSRVFSLSPKICREQAERSVVTSVRAFSELFR